MWVQWIKKSSSTRVHIRSPSFSDHHMTSPFHPSPSPLTPRTPIHKYSISFKDIESLLSNNNNNTIPEPVTPTRLSPSPAHLSLKNIHTLIEDENPTTRNKHPSIFHRVRAWAHRQTHPQPPPDSANKVVVYLTSLRIIRRTYEDCRTVMSILRGYRVRLDERDLSIDRAYVEEFEKVIGGKKEREKVVRMIPRVFVNGKCIGGAEDVRRLHESGELRGVLKDVPVERVVRGGGGRGGCGVCGGCRFVVCEYCDGSHKVFVKEGFVSCNWCNDNGLVKCPCCTNVF